MDPSMGQRRAPARAGTTLARLAVLAALLALALTALTGAARASAAELLAPTPPMGWDPFYSHLDTLGVVDEAYFRRAVTEMLDDGLADAGYTGLGAGNWWPYGQRDANGIPVVDPAQWPSGMRALASWVHARGMRIGIYTDIGPYGCLNETANSYGHYQQDAATFGEWGYDLVAVDWCGAYVYGWSPAQIRAAYTDFAHALTDNASGRQLALHAALYDIRSDNDASWLSEIAQSYRVAQDIGALGQIQVARVFGAIDRMAADPSTTRPGHYRDPDFLLAGVGPITETEGRMQMSMWSMLSAPLEMGADPLTMSAATKATLTNREIIAIDQDPLVRMASRLTSDGGREVWVKHLVDANERAVALLNRTDHSATIGTSARAIGLGPAQAYRLRDVWKHATTTTGGRISATVPAHGAVVYRVAAARHMPHRSPDVAIALSTPGRAAAATGALLGVAGQDALLDVTVENHGGAAISQLDVDLGLPAGWHAVAQGGGHDAIPGGGSTTLRYRVTPVSGATAGSYPLAVGARFRSGGERLTSDAQGDLRLASAPPSGSPFLSDMQPIGSMASGFHELRTDPDPPIVIDGVTYAKSVLTSGPSFVDYWLGGQCSRFTSTVGLDDVDAIGDRFHGRVIIQVLRDGVVVDEHVLESDVSPTAHVDVDVSGAQSLRLNAIDAGTYWNYAYDVAQWGDARVTCR